MSDNLDIILRGRKIKRISDIAFGELRKKYGIKQLEVEILIYLSRNPESSASSFIKEMGLNKGQVSVAMDNLSSGGFITLKRDNKDHRYSHASVTEKALPVLEEAEPAQQHAEREDERDGERHHHQDVGRHDGGRLRGDDCGRSGRDHCLFQIIPALSFQRLGRFQLLLYRGKGHGAR